MGRAGGTGPARARQRRVLIVEDNADLRAVLVDALSDADYEICEASNGREALSLAESWLPDAILLDLMMPDMDGAEFLRARRDRPFLARVPVMVLTAHPFHHRLLDGLGATVVVRKPYNLDELLDAVATMCRGESGQADAC
jgi:two-component system OmpR family response regulator